MATLTLDLPDQFYETLIQAAIERGIPVQEFVQVALAEEIDREKNRQESEAAYSEYLRTGKVSSLSEIAERFEQRLAELGKKTGTQGG